MKLATSRDAVLTRKLNEIKTSVFGASWADFELKLCKLCRLSARQLQMVLQSLSNFLVFDKNFLC